MTVCCFNSSEIFLFIPSVPLFVFVICSVTFHSPTALFYHYLIYLSSLLSIFSSLSTYSHFLYISFFSFSILPVFLHFCHTARLEDDLFLSVCFNTKTYIQHRATILAIITPSVFFAIVTNEDASYVHPCVSASASSASEEEGQPPHHKGCPDILCILSNYTVYGCSYGRCLNAMTCNALGSKNYKDNITST